MSNLASIVFTLVCCIGYAHSLKCYACIHTIIGPDDTTLPALSSDPKCMKMGEDFEEVKKSVHTVECNDKDYPSITGGTQWTCSKSVTNATEGGVTSYSVARGCDKKKDAKKESGCTGDWTRYNAWLVAYANTHPTYEVTKWVGCACAGELCNTGSALISSSLVLILVTMAALLKPF